jgi:hypothetical protein
MQILIMIWEPNEKWNALSENEQQDYLLSLNGAVNEARSNGVMTLGWSAIDRTMPKAPKEGYVGIFAMSDIEQIHQLDSNIQQSKWYDYFETTNVSISPKGGTNSVPSEEYAELLGM